MSKGPSILLCFCSLVGTLCGEEYLSNLANPWIDPGNPTCHCSIGDIHTLFSEYEPFALQFFTGSASDQHYAKMRIGNPGSGATNSTVKSFELNTVTFEFIWGHLQAWSNVNVQLYSQVRKDRVLVAEFGNPTINPGPTQWPESVNPGFCTTYVDYHPLNQILLQPSTEYWLVLNAASDIWPSFGLLFSLSSKYVTSTDWRMGETTTHDPSAAGEYLKCAIGATAIIGTNAPPSAVSDITLSANRVGNQIVLSWPTSTAPAQLYSSTSFESATWKPVSTQPVIINDNFVVTLPSSGSGGYFRLQGQ